MISRRRFATLSAGLLAPVALGLHVSDAKKKKGKTKTVTRSFSNTQTVDIKTFETRSSPIAVSGFKKGNVTDVNVILHGYTHPSPDDVDVLLVAPSGQNALIMSDSGASFDVSGIQITLDDEAADELPNSEQLVSKSYRPANFSGSGDMFLNPVGATPPTPSGNTVLSTFDGGNPNGTWTLFVTDNNDGTTSGYFGGGWSLEIAAQVKKKKKKK